MMTWEGVFSGSMFSLGSGAFMAGYALALGANNFQIGILAALPFVTQFFQIPAIVLVEKMRRRRLLSVPLWFAAQSMWVFVALAPFLLRTPGAAAIAMIATVLGIRGILVAFVNVGWNSWMRDLQMVRPSLLCPLCLLWLIAGRKPQLVVLPSGWGSVSYSGGRPRP